MSERERLARDLRGAAEEFDDLVKTYTVSEFDHLPMAAETLSSVAGLFRRAAALLSGEREPDAGVDMIAAERERQVAEEGWTPEHDDRHVAGELSKVAATLAVMGTDARVSCPDDEYGSGDDPWGLESRHRYDDVRALTIAGALIAAEIDRLLRRARTPPTSASEEDAGLQERRLQARRSIARYDPIDGDDPRPDLFHYWRGVEVGLMEQLAARTAQRHAAGEVHPHDPASTGA